MVFTPKNIKIPIIKDIPSPIKDPIITAEGSSDPMDVVPVNKRTNSIPSRIIITKDSIVIAPPFFLRFVSFWAPLYLPIKPELL